MRRPQRIPQEELSLRSSKLAALASTSLQICGVSLLSLIYGTKAERGRIEVAKASFQRSFPEQAMPDSLS
jgi:hypothetical protein